MLMQLIKVGKRQVARLGRALHRMRQGAEHARKRRAMQELYMLDERFYWDIGLSRGDVMDCLSSPWDEDLTEHLNGRRYSGPAAPISGSDRLAA